MTIKKKLGENKSKESMEKSIEDLETRLKNLTVHSGRGRDELRDGIRSVKEKLGIEIKEGINKLEKRIKTVEKLTEIQEVKVFQENMKIELENQMIKKIKSTMNREMKLVKNFYDQRHQDLTERLIRTKWREEVKEMNLKIEAVYEKLLEEEEEGEEGEMDVFEAIEKEKEKPIGLKFTFTHPTLLFEEEQKFETPIIFKTEFFDQFFGSDREGFMPLVKKDFGFLNVMTLFGSKGNAWKFDTEDSITRFKRILLDFSFRGDSGFWIIKAFEYYKLKREEEKKDKKEKEKIMYLVKEFFDVIKLIGLKYVARLLGHAVMYNDIVRKLNLLPVLLTYKNVELLGKYKRRVYNIAKDEEKNPFKILQGLSRQKVYGEAGARFSEQMGNHLVMGNLVLPNYSRTLMIEIDIQKKLNPLLTGEVYMGGFSGWSDRDPTDDTDTERIPKLYLEIIKKLSFSKKVVLVELFSTKESSRIFKPVLLKYLGIYLRNFPDFLLLRRGGKNVTFRNVDNWIIKGRFEVFLILKGISEGGERHYNIEIRKTEFSEKIFFINRPDRFITKEFGKVFKNDPTIFRKEEEEEYYKVYMRTSKKMKNFKNLDINT